MRPTNYRTRAMQSCDPRFAIILGKIDREGANPPSPQNSRNSAQLKSRRLRKRNRSREAKGSE